MRTRTVEKNLKSTQQSVRSQIPPKYKKYTNTLEGSMFLDDLCADFAIGFSPFSQRDDFFMVKAETDTLKNLLEYSSYSFLRYDFSRMLSKIMYNLVLEGRCYAEIVLWFDENDLLKEISFIPIHYYRLYRSKNKVTFWAKDHQGNKVKWAIPNEYTIYFDLKDIGFGRNHFRKILKGLSYKGLPDFKWFQKHSIPIGEYTNRHDLNLLKIVGDSYWNGRKYDSEYVNEIYLLYRTIMFNTLRHQFLDYFLGQYNRALTYLGQRYGFNGQIVYTVDISDYHEELEKLLAGEINSSEMGDYIFKFKM
ncbi:hypothetical protein ABEW50_20335 [Paenibacillus jamilae]